MFKVYWCLIAIVCSFYGINAQVTGYVYDEQGEPLAFAAVYVKGTTQGTSTNADGKYSLDLSEGDHTLIARYIGYETGEQRIRYRGETKEVDFHLEKASFELNEVVVSAQREDPAYAIIRKAIERRPYYRDLVESYQCDVYIKGAMAMNNVPEKFMGEEITEDPEAFMDSLGLLYLSETKSKYYVRKPNDRKEVVTSSIVSGSNRGLSFNTAFFLSSNLYHNTVDLMRPIVSPIADNALNYYDYKLLGQRTDSLSDTVYQIKVIPKRPREAVFSGILYINEGLWNIETADLFVTGSSLNQPVFDTLRLRKTYVPVQAPDVWMPISHNISFELSALGFGIGGQFIGVFSDYSLGVDFPRGFFNHEMIRYTDSAKQLSQQYWDSIRPIPLSEEEQEDYRVKDSVRRITQSPEYIDSVDRASNRFHAMDVLQGYTYTRRTRQFKFNIGSPIGISGFDAVRGLHLGWPQSVTWWKEDRREENWRLSSKLLYSFGDKVLRGALKLRHQFAPSRSGSWYVRGGKEVEQFNDRDPVLPLLNSWESMINKVHKMKMYERYGLETGIEGELLPGLTGTVSSSYFERSQLFINSTYSLFGNDEPFNSNLPSHPDVDPDFLPTHRAWTLELGLSYTPGQKYLVLPDQRMSLGSRWPTFEFRYKKGIRAFDSDVNFDYLGLEAHKSHALGLIGTLSWRIRHGRFINREELYFMDYAHFLGNETFIGLPSDYNRGFQLLSYYGRSTTDPFSTVHLEHAFEGYIFDKVPLLRAMNWELNIGGRSLLQEPVYSELAIGASNIGINFFRPLRADVVFAFREDEYIGAGFLLGINFLSRKTDSVTPNNLSFRF